MQSKIISRGRVTIPIELRRKLGITAGARLMVRDGEHGLEVLTMEQYVRSLRGGLKGSEGMKALKEDRAREAER